MFGASHNGRMLTKAFHCRCAGVLAGFCVRRQLLEIGDAYPGAEDVLGDGGFVDAGVFVGLEVDESIVGDAVDGFFF